MSYSIARISENNLDDFLYIYECTHQKKPSRDYFSAKFNTAYCGASYVGFIAYSEEGQPAAFYGVFPQQLIIHEQKISAAQSGDTITHPAHRRKGLFEMLFKETVKLCEELEIKIIFGFPNNNSYPGFIKFGWLHLANTTNYSALWPMSIISRIHRRFFPKSFYNWQKQQLAGNVKAIEDINFESYKLLVNQSYPDSVARTKDYFAYKQKLGAIIITLQSGIAVVKYEPNLVEIGELCSNNLHAAYIELTTLLKKCGIQNIQVNSSPNLDLSPAFSPGSFTKRETSALIVFPVDKTLNLSGLKIAYTGLDYDTF